MNRIFRIWGTVIATLLIIAGIAHFIQYLTSPPPSLYGWVISNLLMLAAINGYLFALWFIWKR